MGATFARLPDGPQGPCPVRNWFSSPGPVFFVSENVKKPLVICYIADTAIENGHRNSGCSMIFPLKMVMSIIMLVYQRDPEGITTN